MSYFWFTKREKADDEIGDLDFHFTPFCIIKINRKSSGKTRNKRNVLPYLAYSLKTDLFFNASFSFSMSDYRCRRNQFVAQTLRPKCILSFSFQAQGIGSDSSNANEHSESQPVYQTAQLLHVYTERVPEGQEHSRDPIHNTEARQSPGEATQRCCCLKDQDDGTVRAEGSYCSLCAKLIEEQSRADHLPSVRPAPLPPEYAREFALSLPSLPCESSTDDHNPSEYNEDPSQAEGREKIPVYGM